MSETSETIKVGDRCIVIKCPLENCFSPNKERYRSRYPNSLLNTFDRIIVDQVLADGQISYINGGGYHNSIDKSLVKKIPEETTPSSPRETEEILTEPVMNETQETSTETPTQTIPETIPKTLKKGDRCRVIGLPSWTCDTPDKEQYQKGYPDRSLKIGDAITVNQVFSSGSVSYIDGDNYVNSLLPRCVEKIPEEIPPSSPPETPQETQQETPVETPTLKVGDRLIVTNPVGRTHWALSTRLEVYHLPAPFDRLRKGEIITVSELEPDGTSWYRNARDKPNRIPIDYVEPYKEKPSPEKSKAKDKPEETSPMTETIPKVGDRFIVTKPVESVYSALSTRLDVYGRAAPNDQLQIGEIITLSMFDPDGKGWYKNATGNANQIPWECVEKIEPDITEKPPEVLPVDQAIKPKVGDRFVVTKAVLLGKTAQYSTIPDNYVKTYPDDRLQIGEVGCISSINSDGEYLYKNGGGNSNIVPVDCVRFLADGEVSLENTETTYSAITEGKQVPILEPTLKPGDWVRAIKVSDRQRTTRFLKDLFLIYPQDQMKVGEVFRVEDVYKNHVKYRTGRGSYREIPVSFVEKLPPTYGQKRLAKIYGLIASIPLPFSLFPLYRLYQRNPQMQHFTENVLTDPTVHRAVVALICGVSAFLMGGMGWISMNNVARGIARVNDRGRRIRQEKESTQIAAIYQAIEDAKSKPKA